MTEDEQEIARRLGVAVRAARLGRGLTQRQLGDRLGIAPNYLALLERGERSASLDLVGRVARVLGLDVTDLFGETPGATTAEQLVLRLFRSLSEETQAYAVGVLRVLGNAILGGAGRSGPRVRRAGGNKKALAPVRSPALSSLAFHDVAVQAPYGAVASPNRVPSRRPKKSGAVKARRARKA